MDQRSQITPKENYHEIVWTTISSSKYSVGESYQKGPLCLDKKYSKNRIGYRYPHSFIGIIVISHAIIITIFSIVYICFKDDHEQVLKDFPVVSNFNQSASKYAIVVPFTYWQMDLVLRNLRKVWPSQLPCRNYSTRDNHIDLVLYFHKNILNHPNHVRHLKRLFDRKWTEESFELDDGSIANAKNLHDTEFRSLSECFSGLKFLNANLQDTDDTYPLGASKMFFRLFSNHRIINAYKSIYYMEPDNIPCRPYWLDRLYEEMVGTTRSHPGNILSDYWMRGSVIRDQTSDAGLTYYSDHINGNAFYNIGNQQFREFVEKVEKVFYDNEEKHADTSNISRNDASNSEEKLSFFGSYDIAMYLLRKDRDFYTFQEYTSTLHLWQYTNTIQNWYRTPVNATELCLLQDLSETPLTDRTYLVHGRHVVY